MFLHPSIRLLITVLRDHPLSMFALLTNILPTNDTLIPPDYSWQSYNKLRLLLLASQSTRVSALLTRYDLDHRFPSFRILSSRSWRTLYVHEPLYCCYCFPKLQLASKFVPAAGLIVAGLSLLRLLPACFCATHAYYDANYDYDFRFALLLLFSKATAWLQDCFYC